MEKIENNNEEELNVDKKETQEEDDSAEQDVDWEAEAKKYKSIADRLREKSQKKSEEKSPKKQTPQEINDGLLARLEYRGVTDKKDQDYVLKVAKNENVSFIEALGFDFVKDRLETNKKERQAEKSTPSQNNVANSGQDDLDRAYAQYQKDGSIPNNPVLASKLLKKLKANN